MLVVRSIAVIAVVYLWTVSGCNEPEVDAAVGVGVKGAEDVLGELGGVAVGEEVPVDLLELLDAELSVGAVLEEALVPLLDLGVRELGVVLQVLQHLRLELAILLPHPCFASFLAFV